LLHTLCLFALLPTGFRQRDVRTPVGQLLGRDRDGYTTAQMTYDLRRLRLRGLIERVPQSHRYRITPLGAQIAMLYVRLYARALRPAASLQPAGSARGRQAFARLDAALATFLEEVHLAA
jgi:predicted MarR family transcription regulator